ncbi:hypothetical protein ACTXG6_43005 [Pseudonocardia sp. Cha107L01]|uniref:hypothetical protein n=1 Tax=Pseudonocardia sp. Cha107L01 TaxID=3457576 RepID=UPI00403ED698
MPPEFRRKALEVVKAGRRVAQFAADLDIGEQCIYSRRRQGLVDSGQLPGMISGSKPSSSTLAGGSPNSPFVVAPLSRSSTATAVM